MNIQAEKIALTKLLLNTNNPSIIQSIKAIFSKADAPDFWDTLSYEQQEEIKQGSQDILNDNVSDYKTFISKHKK